MRTQAKALPKSKERFPMSLTGPGTCCVSFSPSQLTFLQCHGRLYYENWPHGVNSATEFSPVKSFPFLPCVQLREVQHHFSICIAWGAQFHPDIIHGKGKVCHLGCASFSKFSFIYRNYRYITCILKIFIQFGKRLYTIKSRLHADMHVYVLTWEGLVEDSTSKVGQSSGYAWCRRSGTFYLGW